MEVASHRKHSNYLLSGLFGLTESCDCDTAASRFPACTWDGILAIVVEEPVDMVDAGILFHLWEPLVAIITFNSVFTRLQKIGSIAHFTRHSKIHYVSRKFML